MEFKGTKGEWKVIGGVILRSIECNGKQIVVCQGKEVEANAKLIAAAPDLLEALLKVREVLYKEWPKEEWFDFDKEIGYTEAINKALKL
jgi:hypothetical protein